MGSAHVHVHVQCAHLLLHEVERGRQRAEACMLGGARHQLDPAQQHGQRGSAASDDVAQRYEDGGERHDALDAPHRLEPPSAVPSVLIGARSRKVL